MRDPYDVLGVSRTATEGEVRDAFRRLAREHHPDRNPNDAGAQERFQEINTAFQILSDPTRRARFDRMGHATSSGPHAARPGFVDLDDLFADLFGGFVAPQAERGDLQRVVEVSFQEAALGCTKTLRYERLDLCTLCSGSGAEEGALRVCTTCGGSGQVQLGVVGLFGLSSARPCPRCDGRGRTPESPCTRCRGNGLASRSREIEITLPPGIENGASQIVRGGGNRVVASRAPGDLELIIRVAAHTRWRREGDDVHSSVEVPFATAALGGSIDVATVHGEVALRVPAGTQHGTRLRLKGQGIPHRFSSGHGDHYCDVKLLVPTNVSERGRELVAALAAELEDDARGFFDRMRSWLSD